MINVLVIGEYCTDKFIYCNSDRFCPEAPVPVLVPVEITENAGMSGNVVRNLKSLNPNLVVTQWHQHHKVTKSRFVHKKSNHIFVRIDEGDDKIETLSLTEKKINEISKFDIVVVSDYNKGFLDLNNLLLIGQNSKLSILDTKRKITDKITESFNFIKLNEKEYENNKHIKNLDNVLITMGSLGTKFKNKLFPVVDPKETIDVSGAGDTFTSSFILNYFETKNIEESINFANRMSSIVVSKKGVSIPK